MHKKSNLVILQARMNSKRLPNKAMRTINDIPMIMIQISRILKAKEIDKVIVATTNEESDDFLCEYLVENKIDVFRGSTNDVLERFFQASCIYGSEVIVRLTADCPLVMPEVIDEMLLQFDDLGVEYFSNVLEETYPDGLDVEIFSVEALKKLRSLQLNTIEKEHVTLGIYRRQNMFKAKNYPYTQNLSALRWTVDYIEDFEFVEQIFKNFLGFESEFGMQDVLEFLAENDHVRNTRDSRFRNFNLHN